MATIVRPSGREGSARLLDVAALARVSVSTASRALNADPRISPATRRRVERAAARLTYRVNPVARALSMKRSFTVGLIVGDIANPYFAQLARHLAECLGDSRYDALLADMNGDPRRQKELVDRFVDRRVDGIFITVPHDPEVLARTDVPIVPIDRCTGPLAYVSTDNVAGGRLAAEHLVSAGYRRIAILHGDHSLTPVKDRYDGFREALLAAGMTLPRELDRRCPTLAYDDAYAAALEAIGHGADAIFAIDDVMAAAAVAAALEKGRRVPEDVGVVGFDDTPIAAWRTLNLTTVAQRTADLARAAADTMLRRIADPALQLPSTILPPHLVVRGSAAGPRRRRR